MSDTINESSSVLMEEDFDLMPDGYGEGDDFFDPESWSGAAADESAAGGNEGESMSEEAEFGGDTTTVETEAAEDSAEAEEPPTTRGIRAGAKIKFSAPVDHKLRDVELDEADIPTVYQKAQVTDRVQAKLGKMAPVMDLAESARELLGYDTAEEMLRATIDNFRDTEIDRLVDEGTPRDIAEDYVGRKMGSGKEKKEAESQRDYTAEAELTLKLYPELAGKTIPDAVLEECVRSGEPLAVCYKRYADKKAIADQAANDAEKKALKKDNKILKQNAEAASRAPVRGVARGGATDTKAGDDPFLAGFDSEY